MAFRKLYPASFEAQPGQGVRDVQVSAMTRRAQHNSAAMIRVICTEFGKTFVRSSLAAGLTLFESNVQFLLVPEGSGN